MACQAPGLPRLPGRPTGSDSTGTRLFVRYIGGMFEVLVFVYENYWRGDACPQWERLERKLSAVGFEAEEIREALTWLSDLAVATRDTQSLGRSAPPVLPPAVQGASFDPSPASMRVYSAAEQYRLGSECLGFISFLGSSGVLSAHMRELVVDRAMASSADVLCLEDLKIIVLMVYWSLGQEPDALVLDELCDDASDRVAH